MTLMGCAALSSELVRKPLRAVSGLTRFGERRVRPFCHLTFRQQTWQIFLSAAVVDGLRLWESRSDFQAWRSGPGVNCRPLPPPGLPAAEGGMFHFWPAPPRPCEP